MNHHYSDGPVTVWHGDCIDVMRQMPDASVDAVVTDPPYGLNFMGKDWDSPAGQMVGQIATGLEKAANGPLMRGGTHSRGYADNDNRAFQAWCELWAAECFRLLKPGGHLLAFGGTRTFHRLTAGIEDAGFEIRDSIAWLYGSGFPKSLDVSKAIDRMAGAERSEGGREWSGGARSGGVMGAGEGTNTRTIYDAPATDDAATWNGFGTALKPAFEPIVVARKPLTGTVAANVLQYGTGALNIDGSRIGTVTGVKPSGQGRWPANVVLDASQAAALDTQSGVSQSPLGIVKQGGKHGFGPGGPQGAARDGEGVGYGDSGGASRFFKTVDTASPRFMYTAKAGSDERPGVDGVSHPTVKPVDLMRWLVKLVTPPGGVVLEPFAGSGTTVEAAVLEGFHCIAIEREADYLPLILKRIRKPHAVGLDFGEWNA